MIGRIATVNEVVEIVMRDQPFFRSSGGGVTLSGGEPLFQPEFVLDLLRACNEAGLHTVVETSGFVPWEVLAEVSRYTDLFLYDLKVMDAARHLEFCGFSNDQIISNARLLSKSGAEIIFRTPVIPSINDGPDDMRMLEAFIASLPGKHPHELMPYHRLGAGKYDALGREYPLSEEPCEQS